MANNISSILNSRIRFSGLSSGLDTDTIIKQLMRTEVAKVDKVKQARQLLEWKRDNYRDITNTLRGFRDTYFDLLKPDKNFRSPSAFATYDIKSGDDTIVTAKASTGAASINHQITVRKLASAAKIEHSDINYTATSAVSGSNSISDFNLLGEKLIINYDGVKKTIALENYVGLNDAEKMADMKSKLQSAINSAIGGGKVEIAASGYNIEFKSLLEGSTFSLSEVPNDLIYGMKYSAGQKNYISGSEVSSTALSEANGNIKVKLGTTEKDIVISGLSDTSTLEDLRLTLENALNDTTGGFGTGSFSVKLNGNKLEIVSNTGAEVVLSNSASDNVLSRLGFANGASASSVSMGAIDMSGNEQYKSIVISKNGIDQEIVIDQNYDTLDNMAAFIESKLSGIDIIVADGKLRFASASGDKLEFKKGLENSLEKLGFSANDNTSNRISLSSDLKSVEKYFTTPVTFAGDDNVSFVINDVVIDLKKKFSEATIQDVINAVNSSSANVELKYDSLHDRFSLASKVTGVAASISFTDTDPTNGLFKALGINIAHLKPGEDAEFDLDGVTGMKRSSNDFSIDGVSYTLKSADPAKTVSISVKANSDALISKVKEFVDKYNEVIDKLNTEYSEKRDKDYMPLTDDQKEAMSEDEIKKWEEKTKAGLLKGDSILNKILTDMRKSLYDTVEGTSTSLYKIGITTGTYEQKGKLVIDETKLKAAIEQNIDSVAQLFTKTSEVSYQEANSDSIKRQTRYNESGIAQRLYDIIQDNIRSTRDADGKKGLLLEKAGITGDISEFKNTITEDMDKQDTLIDTLLDKLVDKEDALYKKFTAMEKALSQMNSQSSWIAQQLSTSQQ